MTILTSKGGTSCRVAMYSHDTMGLGHMRRNLLIAQSFFNSHQNLNVLMIAGASFANNLAMPTGIDCLTLPALHKVSNGNYRSRSLEVGIEEIIEIRRRTISAAVSAFEPDIFIVDNVPRGVLRELDLTLAALRRNGKTNCVLGLRDILDDPQTVRAEWAKTENERAIGDFFDQIWIYGDPAVHNLIEEHDFAPGIAEKAHFTGYFDQRKRLEWGQEPPSENSEHRPATNGERIALCTVGGGEDGSRLAETFAQTRFPEHYYGVILTGPFMPEPAFRRLQHAASQNPRLEVIRHASEPTHLLRSADRVISMGGYNSVSEILSFGKHALIVPRVRPRQEQLIRARRLQEFGLVDCVHPDEATPERFARWLTSELPPLPNAEETIDLNGLKRLPSLLQGLISRPPAARGEPVGDGYGSEANGHAI